MALFTLRLTEQDLGSGILEKVKTDSIDYEKDFENWLENSPNALIDEEDGGGIFWIGRQPTATVGDIGKYPDLIGIDESGDVVVVELKKGKTPREVVAQILEYVSWIATLDEKDLDQMARNYINTKESNSDKSLFDLYKEVFYPDTEEEIKVEFNRNQKLYIVAEEISPIVRQVCQHLRMRYKVNISCMQYQVLKSKQGGFFISTERVVGFEEANFTKISSTSSVPRWNQPIKVKTVIHDAIIQITSGDLTKTFSPSDIVKEVIKSYPQMNSNTVRCQIIQDCVNHSSRKHYPAGQQDYYFLVEKGKYRLYNSEKDGKWNWKGEKIG